jgi:hypothetical protein
MAKRIANAIATCHRRCYVRDMAHSTPLFLVALVIHVQVGYVR